jgi:hypothetical protein
MKLASRIGCLFGTQKTEHLSAVASRIESAKRRENVGKVYVFLLREQLESGKVVTALGARRVRRNSV